MESIMNGRAIIDENYGGLIITIPSQKNWLIIVFFCFFLVFWLLAEIVVVDRVFNSGKRDLILSVWLAGWTVGGVIACFLLFWMWFGKEVIQIDNNVLSIHHNIFGIGSKKEYAVNEVKNIRIDASFDYTKTQWTRTRGYQYHGITGGIIKFDYGFKTISMGAAIEEAEGEFILNRFRLKKYLPESSFK